MLQSALSDQLISLSLSRSFVKFGQSVDLSITTYQWSNPARPGFLIVLRLRLYISTSVRAVLSRYLIEYLKLKKPEANVFLYKMG